MARPISRWLQLSIAWLMAGLVFASQAVSAADLGTPLDKSGTAALTPIGMFLAADAVVKAIIVLLLAASVATWSVLIAKSIEIRIAKRRLRAGLASLRRYTELVPAREAMRGSKGIVPRLLDEATAELALARENVDRDALQWRALSRLEQVEAEAARSLGFGTGLLATIGSTAPFVGLLGTVWGIMNSFIGIAASHTTNLAVVAPGIAEALLTTAVGLIAAVPAVVVYNGFARAIDGYRAMLRQASAEIARMVSRSLEAQSLIRPKRADLRIAAE